VHQEYTFKKCTWLFGPILKHRGVHEFWRIQFHRKNFFVACSVCRNEGHMIVSSRSLCVQSHINFPIQSSPVKKIPVQKKCTTWVNPISIASFTILYLLHIQKMCPPLSSGIKPPWFPLQEPSRLCILLFGHVFYGNFKLGNIIF
jgi:hypothetical protein